MALQAVFLQDSVQSYFGRRKISLGKVPGESNPRIMLNNMFLFQMGVLDQVSTPTHKLMYDVWHWFGLAFLLLHAYTLLWGVRLLPTLPDHQQQ